jgi:hypothetical protein
LAVDGARQFVFHTVSPVYPVAVDLIGLAIIAGLFLLMALWVAKRTMSAK